MVVERPPAKAVEGDRTPGRYRDLLSLPLLRGASRSAPALWSFRGKDSRIRMGVAFFSVGAGVSVRVCSRLFACARKAVEGHRTPGRYRDLLRLPLLRGASRSAPALWSFRGKGFNAKAQGRKDAKAKTGIGELKIHSLSAFAALRLCGFALNLRAIITWMHLVRERFTNFFKSNDLFRRIIPHVWAEG